MAQQIRNVLLNGTDAAGGMQDDDLARMNSNLAQHFFDVLNDVQIIFERADNYLERISFRQVSPESLAAALKPYVDVDNISFDQVIDNTKYIKAAYLLGVRKYQPRFKGDNLGLAIYENDYMTSVEKQELFEWLLEQNYFSTNPLSLQTMLNGLISGKDLSFGCLLKKFPIDEAQIERYYPLDIDPANQHKRNNILHASVYEGNILKMWNSFLNIYSTEEMVQLLLETNKLNRSALFLIVSNYLNDANRLPKEILLGFTAIAKSGDLNQLKDFNMIMQFEGSSVYLLMYKYGITPDKIQQGQLYYQQANNPFEIAHNKSYQFNEQTNNASNSCWSLTDTFPIETMLPELIWTISEYLDITGLVGLFTASKTMTRFIKKKDDRFWRQVYERNIYVNNKIHSYKKMVLEYARSAPNWLKRNFHKITLDGIQASSLMDENWLVLFDSLCIYLWDCHTQQTHLICETDGQMWRYEPIRILGGVYDGTCPPVLLREKGNDGITVIYRLAVNGEFILLDELQHQGVADVTENSKMISIHQIDENLLLLPNNKIFDIQSRTFIDSTTSNHIGLIYNPFNHTYITLNGKRLFEVRDMNHQPLRQFEAKPECNNSLIRLLNESTLIIYSGYGSIWLIDFKGTDVVQKVISPEHSRFSSFKLPYSLDRAILADNRTGLVTICHLPSMQWQAVYHLQATVTAANSRYLVGNENGNAVIYDFYK